MTTNNYIARIKEYCNDLPQELQQEVLIQIKKLHVKGFSYEWIYTAITHKEVKDWLRYGFGLLWTKGYQSQITNFLEREHAQLGNISATSLSWDLLMEEEETESKTNSSRYVY